MEQAVVNSSSQYGEATGLLNTDTAVNAIATTNTLTDISFSRPAVARFRRGVRRPHPRAMARTLGATIAPNPALDPAAPSGVLETHAASPTGLTSILLDGPDSPCTRHGVPPLSPRTRARIESMTTARRQPARPAPSWRTPAPNAGPAAVVDGAADQLTADTNTRQDQAAIDTVMNMITLINSLNVVGHDEAARIYFSITRLVAAAYHAGTGIPVPFILLNRLRNDLSTVRCENSLGGFPRMPTCAANVRSAWQPIVNAARAGKVMRHPCAPKFYVLPDGSAMQFPLARPAAAAVPAPVPQGDGTQGQSHPRSTTAGVPGEAAGLSTETQADPLPRLDQTQRDSSEIPRRSPRRTPRARREPAFSIDLMVEAAEGLSLNRLGTTGRHIVRLLGRASTNFSPLNAGEVQQLFDEIERIAAEGEADDARAAEQVRRSCNVRWLSDADVQAEEEMREDLEELNGVLFGTRLRLTRAGRRLVAEILGLGTRGVPALRRASIFVRREGGADRVPSTADVDEQL